MKKLLPWICCIIALCFVFVATPCLADGVYIPAPAYEKIPDIPHQRALIKYKDGLETLVVESTLSGPGDSFGWIIPIPGVPLSMEETSAGFITTLSVVTKPGI